MSARVGIVMPSYNRAEMLPTAIDSVLAQDFPDWELIVVDDNSTDHTRRVLEDYAGRDRRVRWVRNDRYGHSCSGARKRGIDELDHELAAFLDSDDRWPEYHLSELVALLDAHPDVDWVYGDLTRVDEAGRVVVESKLRDEWPGSARLVAEERDGLFVMGRDRLVEGALEHGLPAAFQTSLIRSWVFREVQLREVPRCDDRLFVYEAAAAGATFAYTLRNHLTFLVHEGNMSGARRTASFERREKVNLEMADFWRHQIPAHLPMSRERRAILRRHLADHLVWRLGNSVYRDAGRRRQALACIARGILLRPFEWRYWKSLLGTLIGRG